MAKFKNEIVRAVDPAGRELPHDPDAERACLAAVMTDGPSFDAVEEVLTTCEPFHVDAHRRIYDAALSARAQGRPVDVTTVASVLRERDELIAVGGFVALSRLLDTTPVYANVQAYAKVVLEQHDRRRLIQAAQVIAGEGYAWTSSTREYLEHVRTTLDGALDATGLESDDTATESMADALEARRASLVEQWKGEREWVGLSTGLPSWDALIGGMRPGEQHVLSALTGGGKSTIGMQAVVYASGGIANGTRVGSLVVSAEMTTQDLIDRQLCAFGAVTDAELQSGKIGDDTCGGLVDQARANLASKPIEFVQGRKTHEQIRAICRRVQRQWDERRRPDEMRTKLAIVLIDYLQIMNLPRRQGLRSDESIAEFSGAMKQLALDLGVHVILVSQFNREGSKSGEPTLNDLAGGAAIENDSDLITYVHRPSPDGAIKDLRDCAELVLKKGRKRPRGDRRRVRFEGELFRFVEADELDKAR